MDWSTIWFSRWWTHLMAIFGFSTQQGVTAWNARKKSFENYMFSRNPMGNVYNENSAVCLDDGRVVLGGNYGLTIIQPSRLSHVSGLTDVVFTSYPYSDEITLTYEQRSLNIHFSTLDYSDVRNVKYTYRLEGFDQAWSQPSSTPWAAFRNCQLASIFCMSRHVRRMAPGVRRVHSLYHIKPPFYLTYWAIMIYVLLVLGVIILVVKFVHDKNVLRNRIRLEQELLVTSWCSLPTLPTSSVHRSP